MFSPSKDLAKYNDLVARELQLQTLLDSMVTHKWRLRPECRQVLEKYNEWSIDRHVVINSVNFDEILNTLKSHKNTFFYDLLSTIKLNSIAIETIPANTHVNDARDIGADDEPPAKRINTEN